MGNSIKNKFILTIFTLVTAIFTSDIALASNSICNQAFRSANIPLAVDLSIESIKPNLTYDYSKTRGQLKSISPSHKHSHGVFVNGLTIAEFQSSVSGEFIILDLKNGYSCVWPSRILAEMGYTEMEVLVAKEFPAGSCEYNETIKHENEHVKINFNTFNKYLILTQNQLNSFIKSQFPILARSSNPDDAAISSVNKYFYSIMKQMEAERDGLNNALDSPQNYAAIQKRCKDW